MKEASLRQWHRQLGVVLALFLFVQGLTGFLLSVTWLVTPHDHMAASAPAGNESKTPHAAVQSGGTPSGHAVQKEEESFFEELIEELHFGGGNVGTSYRVLLGAATALQVILGFLVYTSMRKRTKKA